MLIVGDCFDTLKGMSDNSVDSLVTDPPYGLSKLSPAEVAELVGSWVRGESADLGKVGFADLSWDATVPPPKVWAEVLRVLKPGGIGAVFCHTRTLDLMVLSLRLAGFEIRDTIGWVHSMGMPKASNIGKKLKQKGFDELGEKFNDFFTGLKPALEPIILVQKPYPGPAWQNVVRWGVGGYNIGATRTPFDEAMLTAKARGAVQRTNKPTSALMFDPEKQTDRIVLDEPIAVYKDGGLYTPNVWHDGSEQVKSVFPQAGVRHASTFFNAYPPVLYFPKANKADKHDAGPNHHPTVKSSKLMEALVKLVTPPGGLVLDPFAGSGSTAVACIRGGFPWVAIELDEGYAAVARKRVQLALDNTEVGD